MNESKGLMVLVLDGSSEYGAQARRKIFFSIEKFKFETALEIIKCLKQIK